MQNCSCFTRKQTCNGEYTKHCTRNRHQIKMAAPAEVSKKRSNFRIIFFKEKRIFNTATNLTLNTMASFVTLLIARTARIACSDRHRQSQKVKSVIDTPVTGGNTMPRTNIVQRRVHTKLYEVANNKQ